MPKSSRRSGSKPAQSTKITRQSIAHLQIGLFRMLVDAFREKIRTYQAWHLTPKVPDLVAAYQAAARHFDEMVEAWIARGKLDRTLEEVALRGLEPKDLLIALHDHIHQRSESRLVLNAGQWEEWTVIGWPLVAADLNPDPSVWDRLDVAPTLHAALAESMHLDAGAFEVYPWPTPIHPMAWGKLSLDQHVAVFDEQVRRQPGAGAHALIHRDVHLRERMAQISGDDVATLTRIWPVWVRWNRGPGPAPETVAPTPQPDWTNRLRQALPHPVWHQLTHRFWEATAAQVRVEAPLAMEDALAYSALLHVRSRQALDDRAQGLDASAQRAIRLTALRQKGRSLCLSFQRDGQPLSDRVLPWQWLGTSYRGRDQTIAQLSMGWGSDQPVGPRTA